MLKMGKLLVNSLLFVVLLGMLALPISSVGLLNIAQKPGGNVLPAQTSQPSESCRNLYLLPKPQNVNYQFRQAPPRYLPSTTGSTAPANLYLNQPGQ